MPMGTAEIVMCDVMKIRQKKERMRGEVGKETTKKDMDNRRIFMTLHMTLSAVPCQDITKNNLQL